MLRIVYSNSITIMFVVAAMMAILIASCSTTRNLPEGEILYTGIKQIDIEGNTTTNAAASAIEEIDNALACPPNNALFGSSSVRIPLPVGLWVYNSFVNSKGGIGKWIYKQFASQPVFISKVNPNIRIAIARNLMLENGYFDGEATYEIIEDVKNPRKARIAYRINLNQAYTYDSIRYISTRSLADSIIALNADGQLLRKGDNFNVVSLEAERQRISTLLRSEGFYYHRPDFTVFQADTLISSGNVWLRVLRKSGLPQAALTPFTVGDISISLNGYDSEEPTDSVKYKDLTLFYEGKLRVDPEVLRKRISFRKGDLYSEIKEKQTQTSLARLQIFRFAEMKFTPRDTSRNNNILDLKINTLYDYPYNGEFHFSLTDKSNNLRGPGVTLSLTRGNLLGGGEMLRVETKGSYEWQTHNSKTSLNNFEIGAGATLTLPFVLLPSFTDRGLLYPSSTTIKASAEMLNRATFFRMLSFNASLSYEFLPNVLHRHTFTPLRLTYSHLQSVTEEFERILSLNASLRLSLSDQLIPAFGYKYTYDDASISKPHHSWWETSFTESGNLISAIYAIGGNRWNENNKQMLGNAYSQFLKATGEFRHNHSIDRNNRIVMRLFAGGILSYGNSKTAPFSEQFYVGGANSIRAFNIRSVGPGRTMPTNAKTSPYAYIDQTGELKFEANLEYRFRITGDLYGATFLDWGGIWLTREDDMRPGSVISARHFLNDLALGTGAGLRYDLEYIVVRLDVGYGLHVPYNTGKSGYFNMPGFGDSFNYHLAIGYPF